MDMPPGQTLRKVREEVLASKACSKLQNELVAQIRLSTRSSGDDGRQLEEETSFGYLSPDEKMAAVERAVEAVGRTPAYAKLQSTVASSVDRHFSPLFLHHHHQPELVQEDSASSYSSRPAATTNPLADACSVLLESSPHLKHSLKYALNHPLSSSLRLSAWKAMLRRPDIQKDFLVYFGDETRVMQPENEAEREIEHRCRDILKENHAFSSLAESSTAAEALLALILYWKRRTGGGGEVLDAELLLCIPFLHVWRKELEEQREDRGGGGGGGGGAGSSSGRGGRRLLLAEIAAQYVHLLEMRPPSISSFTESSDGIGRFVQKVAELLQTEDPQLVKALWKALKQKRRGSWRRDRGDDDSTFYISLKSLLFPRVQRMLVGDLSIDVVCFIWDQCFIGMDVADYHCLPHFTTVWLLLLRSSLLKASSIEAVKKVLMTESHSLPVLKFQQEMEKTFLSQLSRSLRVKPLPLQSSSSSDSFLLPPLPSATCQPQPLLSPPPVVGQNPSTSTSSHHTKKLQERMEKMQEKVEREQRILSHRIRQEKELQYKQLERFRKELEELKMVHSDQPSSTERRSGGLWTLVHHTSPEKRSVTVYHRVGSEKKALISAMQSSSTTTTTTQ